MKGGNIAIIATLDTRGEAIKYFRDLIRERGHNPIVIDVCSSSASPPFKPDVTHEKVASAIGKSVEEIASKKEAEGMSLMADGASVIVRELHSKGKLDGMICIGGSMGTSLGLKVMKNLPMDIPKLAMSTVAFTPLITPESVTIDLVMMQTITHACFLDEVTEMVLERAAGSICGMVEARGAKKEKKVGKPIVGITTLGASVFTYADYCTELLREKGYDPVLFHTIGINACDQLIREGYISGVLDFSIFELANYVGGGVLKSEGKLKAAAEKGIPQVVAPGAVSWFQWTGAVDTIPARYKGQKIRWHNPLTSAIELLKDEKIEVAKLMAERLNKAKGPAALLIPLKGFSKMEQEGGPHYDPESQAKFIDYLKKNLNPEVVKLIELDLHINDPAFSEKAVELLDAMIKETAKKY